MKRFSIFLFSLIAAFTLNAQSECGLDNFSYEVIPDGNVFYIAIDQPTNIYENFNVYINDIPMESPDGKFGPFEADCSTFNSIAIFKRQHEECYVIANIGRVCSSDECNIRDLEVSFPECNPNGLVYVTLDFNYSNVSDSFRVKGNGQDYGEFVYSDLPIELGPFPGDCNTEYEFVVQDSKYNNCRAEIDNIIICCPIDCGPPIFEIVDMECSDQKVKMKLFLVEGFYQNNITIKINEEYITNFEIDSNFIYLSGDLPLDIAKHTISVCSVGISEECCFTQEFSTDNCSSGSDCKIYAMEYDVPECQPNEEVFISLDFKYKNTVSDSFIVQGNGVFYGEFAYTDLPVSVGPFQPSCNPNYELVAYDAQDQSCKTVLESIIICCSDHCLEPIFELISMDCDSDLVQIKLELIHPIYGDDLWISVDGDSVLNYKLDYPYVYIETLNNGGEFMELQICTTSSNLEFCCYSQIVDLINCNDNGNCKIGNIQASPSQCNDAEIPYFKLDFEYANVGSKGFSVIGNGHDYGDFSYEDLPILIYVGDSCDVFYEFVVIDNENQCSSEMEYGYFCCTDNCSFKIDETRVKCNDGLITEIAFYLFEETDPIKFYSIYANGLLIGETEINNEFIELNTQIPLDGANQIELTVCDDQCCVSRMLDISECYDDPTECSITNVEISELACASNTLNLVNFVLDFDHQGTSSGQFDIYSLTGLYGTFSYADLPMKIENYPGSDIGLNVLFICDKGTLCCQAKLFSPPTCLIVGPGGDDETTGVQSIHENKFNYIKTNPINNTLILNSPYTINTYHLYSSAGQKVTTVQSINKETLIDTSPYTPGMYLVRIENEAGIKIEKLIIAK
ncbi:T9SS type A sorting domain-containing protein [Portibacter lacus]|uniref:Secretion system C-terminal sorting domain-containing protein n=1 Tax=Portibacter lacus TaxID=1099794 RepID=A0AA37SR86_9BACT|nr:T9SS type A sorting domain-containing protein [Portibacter lacus]GLR18445.1 hypothetical protein GCM10007940_30610 [Portibacter lacus]